MQEKKPGLTGQVEVTTSSDEAIMEEISAIRSGIYATHGVPQDTQIDIYPPRSIVNNAPEISNLAVKNPAGMSHKDSGFALGILAQRSKSRS